ncbi:hypothetical protein [Salinibacterium sp. M195]|uniref:hypothetical protein n=1 Tax=Salinibacterium sp. M195 TaxID=2583374 RepID=UPI001C62F661|nr:hypothetical protein [Salinibacterium sp. M195]QYH34790.1 hypothetical protein FFT87_01850 [Salinibacterium sp. M195]
MFWFWAFLAIGIATGVALSGARTPVIRHVRMIGVVAIGTGLVLLILFNSTASSELTFVYAIAVALSELTWTARTWTRLFPESGMSFRDLFLDELVAPNRVRIAYAQMLLERDGDPLGADPETPVEAEDDPNDSSDDTDDPDAGPPLPPAPRGFPA